jgi:hypothetical protein
MCGLWRKSNFSLKHFLEPKTESARLAFIVEAGRWRWRMDASLSSGVTTQMTPRGWGCNMCNAEPNYVGAGSPAVSGEKGTSAGRCLAFAPLGPHIA